MKGQIAKKHQKFIKDITARRKIIEQKQFKSKDERAKKSER